jgi:hypothetical protein
VSIATRMMAVALVVVLAYMQTGAKIADAAPSTSPCTLQVPLPKDIHIAPTPIGLDPKLAAFAGAWEGKWGGFRDSRFIVESINATQATVVYGITSFGSGQGTFSAGSWRVTAQVVGGNTLVFPTGTPRITFTISNDLNNIFGIHRDPSGIIDGRVTMSRCSMPSGETSGKDRAIQIAKDIISTANRVCKIMEAALDACGFASSIQSQVLSLIGKVTTILNFGNIYVYELALSNRLSELDQALKTYGKGSPQVKIAAYNVCRANQDLHRSLVGLVPGLSFVFPVPACPTP